MFQFIITAMAKILWKKLHAGSCIFSGNVGLAPMAGTSDISFREICAGMGSALGITELVTARGIRFDPSLSRCYRYLEINPEKESKVGIQLFGFDPEDFHAAIHTILEHPVLHKVNFIDLNMGCPVPKVVKTGAGSALMKNPVLAEKIIRTSVQAAASYQVPITVKFRKGWDDTQINAPDFAKMCVHTGASLLCIHARTRSQMYSGAADWNCIENVVSAVRDTGVPVLGNGDVHDVHSATRMITETGADGLLIGRAAQGNPWIFKQIKAAFQADSDDVPKNEKRSRAEITQILLQHLQRQIQRLSEPVAVREMRSQFAYYLKGHTNAAFFKNKLMSAKNYTEVKKMLQEWILS